MLDLLWTCLNPRMAFRNYFSNYAVTFLRFYLWERAASRCTVRNHRCYFSICTVCMCFLSIIVVLCYLHLAVVTLISSKLVVMIMHIFSASCETCSVVISFLNSLKSLFLLNFLLQSSTAVQISFPRSVHFFISPLVNWKRNLHSPPCDRVCQQPQRVWLKLCL